MKHRLLTCVFMFFACLTVVGQVNQVWWSKGRVLHVNPVAGIDSVTFGQFVNADTFLIVIDRASRRIVYDTIDEHVPGMVFHDTIHTTHTVYLNPGRRIGVFSVAKDRQVSFSQGNLQYVRNQDVWKFADQQYEYIGARNVKDGELANKIDLFGWSADNTTAPFGVSTSTNNADYAGEFVDWGVNEINIDAPNTWRTLSKDEWEYLINERPNAQQLRTKGSVNGNGGVILLPDDWVCPTECSVIMVPDEMNLLPDVNDYSLEEWRRMEDAGAVLLTAAGMRRNKDVVIVQHENIFGGYWASTIKSAQNSYCYNFHIQTCEYVDYSYWIYGRSVRLVHDTIVPPPAPCMGMVVKVNDTLSINMMCVEGGTFMMGAMEGDAQANANEKPAHEVTLTYDYYMGQTEVTQGLWKAVMGSDNNPSTMKGDDLPVNNVLWGDARAFVYKLNQMTGLSFDLPTEAEWQFAARGGNRSKGYLYAGSDNVRDVAWYSSNSGGVTHTVATKQPNELGIYDMSGNVFEWCSDWLAPYSAEAQVDPKGPISGEYHVYCGGGWSYGDVYCRSSYRRITTVGYIESALGFRVVLREKVEPEYVDLGLSVKWATFNLGASAPEEYGNYFAWGEVEPKAEYSWENYKWGDGTESNMTKYNNIDGLTTLKLEDDAAHVNWGGKWRMPTDAEFTELREKCIWEWITQNGVNGYKVIGVNGNSIFLPLPGFYYDNGLVYVNDHGDYWSSTKNVQSGALHVYTDLDKILKSSSHRYYGFPIRAVYDDNVVILTINCIPEDAEVGFHYSGGYHVHGNSVMVKKGASPLYQVAATKEGYLSQGDTLHNITKDTTLNITLKPFSEGTWVKIDNSEFTKVESYYVSKKTGQFVGPHSNWNYFYAPVVPGETYRVCANAGQLAAIWYAASNAPNQEDSIRPKKVACSENGGIVRYIAEEFTIPEGATYLIINHAGKDKNLVIERKVPDPCQVVRVNDTLAINMMCVEGGTFMMGDNSSDNASPAHQVTLSDYYIGQTEVTQALWTAVMGANPSKFRGNNLPVECVSWEDCQLFVQKLSEMTGLHFRLPTEAEWEYAARGGVKSRGYVYAGSDDVDSVAWYGVNSGQKTHSIAGKKPNELGIYDMSGNVWEWCQDWHEPYTAESQENPQGAKEGEKPVIRGGCWHYNQMQCTPTYRYSYHDRTGSGSSVGFRIVLDISNKKD